MARSTTKTVAAYLKELPAERRAVVAAVRDMIVQHLPKGYEETMEWGFPTYQVPLARYPDTYNKRPLMFVALAAQKHFYALYLTGCLGDLKQRAALEAAFAKVGKKLDAGKSCIRFQKPADLPLPAIGRIIAKTPPAALIDRYEKSRAKA